MNRAHEIQSQPPPNEAVMLLRDIRDSQIEQNNLLAKLIKKQLVITNKTEHWKQHNSELSQRCGKAAKKSSDLMFKLVDALVEDIEKLSDTDDDVISWGGENFEFYELIDKYSYKLQQFNLIIQTLAHLGTQ